MAIATEPTHAAPAGYVDFDEFIDYQITKTRSGIKATDQLTALIGGIAVVLAYVLVFALFDHWIIEGGFGTTTRIVLLSLLVVGLIAWSIWKLVLPYFRQVTPLYAASQIEHTQPDLKNSLLTLIDLKRAKRPVPEAIEAALERHSAVSLSHMDVEQAVDRRLLMKLSYVLFALVVFTCAYVLFSPKKLSNSLWRALIPTSNVSVATRTRIDNVEPGDVEVLARAQLAVSADLSGEVPEDVTLLFSTGDRRFVDEPVTMRQTDEGLRRFDGVITGENGAGILQNLTYRIVAGDAESEIYNVTVKQPPSATVQSVRYVYPSYMGLDERSQPGGAIDAWEGTWVNVRAQANMPLESAMILFSDTDDTSTKAEEIPAEIEKGTAVTARWQLRIRSDGTYPGFYRIQCRNAAGETDVEPTLYSIKIRPDLSPQIQLAQPTGDIERPANAIVPLLYAAEDQDFLLRSVILHMELNGEVLPQQPRLFQAPPFRKSVHDVHNLELESLELKAGDRLTYWLQARDNMEPFADRSGNRANTPKLNITIIEATTPDQVQEQLEEDQQQIAEKLDEAGQQPNEEAHDPAGDQPEMADDTPPPPPNADQQPGEERPPSESPNEDGEPQEGQPGGEGEQQPQGTEGQSEKRGEQGERTQPGAKSGENGERGSEDQPQGEESFDDLLKKLMQQQQQRQKEPGAAGQEDRPKQQGEDQPKPDQPQQQPGTSQENSSGQGESQDDPGQTSPQPGTSGERSPSSSPGESASEQTSPGTQPAMNEGTSSSEGADSSQPPSDSANPQGTQPQPGEAPSGESQPGDSPSSQNQPTNDTTTGGQKQPGEDSTGAKPGAVEPTNGTQPKPGSPTDPETMDQQPTSTPGEATDNSPAKTGDQPAGADEPMQGEGDPQGQKSERPQTGEGGNSQQSSEGNKGSEQKGPGDSTGEKGTQEAAREKPGQPGESEPGEGSQQKPGGDKPGTKGSEGAAQDAQKPSTGETGQKPVAEGDQPSAEGDKPQMADEAQPGGKGDPPQPQGADNKPSAEGNGEKPQPGQSESAQPGQPGEGQPGEGQPGEGQPSQPGEGQPGQGQPGDAQGGKPGVPPEGGQPGASGGGTASDGGKMDLDSAAPPGGDGAGNDAPAGEGNANANPSSGPQAEEADLDAKKEAADLVLERLQEQLQRGELDPALREDLNVTPEQLQEFTKKLEQRLAEMKSEDTSPEAEARRRQFEETLRTIDYTSEGTTRSGGDGPRESAGGFARPNRAAPAEHRDAARLFRERMLRKQRERR